MADKPSLEEIEVLHKFHTESVDAVMKVWESRLTMNADVSAQSNRENLRAYFEVSHKAEDMGQ